MPGRVTLQALGATQRVPHDYSDDKWLDADAECKRLREQVATLAAQLQGARTEYRVACEDFNELLDKTSDW